jgi:uncharacterized membrane protein
VAGLEVNTLWDGLFHAVAWVAVVVGLSLLYSRVRATRPRVWSWRALWGWVLAGWGLFNLVEGDVGFLVFGAALVSGGYLMQRSARR